MTVDPLVSLIVAGLAAGILILLFRPDKGLFWNWRRTRQLTERVLIEDALKHLHESQMDGRSPTVQSLAGALSIADSRVAELLEQMADGDLLQMHEGEYRLTPEGRDYALHIIRAHRLWEHYLAEETGYADPEWHARAHREEHRMSPEEVDALATQLNNPTHDPHGDPIPTASGEIPYYEGQPLARLEPDTPARIVHLEDEPATLYAQLVAEGLQPGTELRVIEVTPQRVRFWADGEEHRLAPVLAANISVVPLPRSPQPQPETATERLAHLHPGEKARVAGIASTCRGAERRRFLDLGILPGTLIEAAMASPSGNPTAYRVRGALIALRRDQAEYIQITREKEVA